MLAIENEEFYVGQLMKKNSFYVLKWLLCHAL